LPQLPTVTWVEILLTAVFGLLTYSLGRYNSKTERLKIRLQLHDRRMIVFRETMQFLTDAYADKEMEWARWVRFREIANESYFILGKDIHEFLLKMNAEVSHLYAAKKKEDNKEIGELRKRIEDQCVKVFGVFAKHMSLVEPPDMTFMP
jgi:hypothetical protein